MPKRKQYTPEFTANAALDALKAEATVSELANRFGVQAGRCVMGSDGSANQIAAVSLCSEQSAR